MSHLHPRRPTAVIWTSRAKNNLRAFAELAERSGARFRPHFKTHQWPPIGDWFREAGVDSITVSSVQMGQMFADAGWDDITLALPMHPAAVDTYRDLAVRVDRLGLITDSVDAVERVGDALSSVVRCWIELDIGQNRTGVSVDDHAAAIALADAIGDHASWHLAGLLCHAGHAYACRSAEDIRSVYDVSRKRLLACRDALDRAGHRALPISFGDTPTCSVVDVMEDMDELRPGNGLFYDLQQTVIGSCGEEQIALAVACPVVSVHPERSELVVHGGAVHLSKDTVTEPRIGAHYGGVALPTAEGWSDRVPGAVVRTVSQEHGVIHTQDPRLLGLKPGAGVVVLPAHSCLTMDLLRNNGEVSFV